MTDQHRVASPRGSIAGDFLTGASFLFRGLAMYARNPRLMALGLLPTVLTGALLAGGLALLVYFINDLAALLTPFADSWSPPVRDTARASVGAVILVAWLLLALLLFTELTLLVGQPFYEAISKGVEDRLGGVPGEINVSFWRTLPRTIVDNIKLIVLTLLLGSPLLVGGLVPVVGETAVPLAAAVVGGWVLALELSSVPFERRGLRFRDRRRMLGERRAMALGFGIVTFLFFIVPCVAVFAMPAAVAGATLLARRLFGQPGA